MVEPCASATHLSLSSWTIPEHKYIVENGKRSLKIITGRAVADGTSEEAKGFDFSKKLLLLLWDYTSGNLIFVKKKIVLMVFCVLKPEKPGSLWPTATAN
jgi:hypothetical protein